MASCCEDKDPAGEVLQLLKTSLSLGKCQENYRSTYKPFLVSCIHSEGKEERLALLKRCFQIEGLCAKTNRYVNNLIGISGNSS